MKELLQGHASPVISEPQRPLEVSNSLRVFFCQLWMCTYGIETNLGTYTLQFIAKSTYLSFDEIGLSLGEANLSLDEGSASGARFLDRWEATGTCRVVQFTSDFFCWSAMDVYL